MLLNNHPYLFIYLLGCLCVFLLAIFKVIFFGLLGWLRKENILRKNAKKVSEPDETTFWWKVVRYLATILFESALSWINVAVILWRFLYYSLNYIREVFATIPEEIKLLRFPLYTNPNMSREAVWAYFTALEIKAGRNQPDEDDLIDAVNMLKSYYPEFDDIAALNELNSLNIMESELINSVKDKIASYKETRNRLDEVRSQRDEIINKLADEGKTVPIDTFIRNLDVLLEKNPENKEIAFEVETRKQELLTKYKDGIPVEVAYQWMKDGVEEFGWDAIHSNSTE